MEEDVEDDWFEPQRQFTEDVCREIEKEGDGEEGGGFTPQEMEVLVQEVEKRSEALFGEYKEGESPKSRWLIWQEVAEKVNEISPHHRNLEQVRLKWFEHKNPKKKMWKKKRLVPNTGMFLKFGKGGERTPSPPSLATADGATDADSNTSQYLGLRGKKVVIENVLSSDNDPIILKDGDTVVKVVHIPRNNIPVGGSEVILARNEEIEKLVQGKAALKKVLEKAIHKARADKDRDMVVSRRSYQGRTRDLTAKVSTTPSTSTVTGSSLVHNDVPRGCNCFSDMPFTGKRVLGAPETSMLGRKVPVGGSGSAQCMEKGDSEVEIIAVVSKTNNEKQGAPYGGGFGMKPPVGADGVGNRLPEMAEDGDVEVIGVINKVGDGIKSPIGTPSAPSVSRGSKGPCKAPTEAVFGRILLEGLESGHWLDEEDVEVTKDERLENINSGLVGIASPKAPEKTMGMNGKVTKDRNQVLANSGSVGTASLTSSVKRNVEVTKDRNQDRVDNGLAKTAAPKATQGSKVVEKSVVSASDLSKSFVQNKTVELAGGGNEKCTKAKRKSISQATSEVEASILLAGDTMRVKFSDETSVESEQMPAMFLEIQADEMVVTDPQTGDDIILKITNPKEVLVEDETDGRRSEGRDETRRNIVGGQDDPSRAANLADQLVMRRKRSSGKVRRLKRASTHWGHTDREGVLEIDERRPHKRPRILRSSNTKWTKSDVGARKTSVDTSSLNYEPLRDSATGAVIGLLRPVVVAPNAFVKAPGKTVNSRGVTRSDKMAAENPEHGDTLKHAPQDGSTITKPVMISNKLIRRTATGDILIMNPLTGEEVAVKKVIQVKKVADNGGIPSPEAKVTPANHSSSEKTVVEVRVQLDASQSSSNSCSNVSVDNHPGRSTVDSIRKIMSKKLNEGIGSSGKLVNFDKNDTSIPNDQPTGGSEKIGDEGNEVVGVTECRVPSINGPVIARDDTRVGITVAETSEMRSRLIAGDFPSAKNTDESCSELTKVFHNKVGPSPCGDLNGIIRKKSKDKGSRNESEGAVVGSTNGTALGNGVASSLRGEGGSRELQTAFESVSSNGSAGCAAVGAEGRQKGGDKASGGESDKLVESIAQYLELTKVPETNSMPQAEVGHCLSTNLEGREGENGVKNAMSVRGVGECAMQKRGTSVHAPSNAEARGKQIKLDKEQSARGVETRIVELDEQISKIEWDEGTDQGRDDEEGNGSIKVLSHDSAPLVRNVELVECAKSTKSAKRTLTVEAVKPGRKRPLIDMPSL